MTFITNKSVLKTDIFLPYAVYNLNFIIAENLHWFKLYKSAIVNTFKDLGEGLKKTTTILKI